MPDYPNFAGKALFKDVTEPASPDSGNLAVYSESGVLKTKTSAGVISSMANMNGATTSVAGTAGLVPAPAAGKQNSVLMGDATFLNLDDIKMLPDQVSDCALWLRSDDLVTSGSNVTTWNNKVNSNKNAGQSTATKQPTLQTNQINGLSAVRFDGTDDCLTISSFDLTAEVTVFLVAKQASTAKPVIIEHSDVVDTNDGFLIYGHQSVMTARRTNASARLGQSNWAGTSWFIGIFRFDSTPYSYFSLFNGKPIGLNTIPTAGPTALAISNNSSVSTTLNIGSRNNGASVQSSADHAEIIIYNRPLWDFEISCINNYLKDRYAL